MNPSVSTLRPNLCARNAPAIAAAPLTVRKESPVNIPLWTALRPRAGLPFTCSSAGIRRMKADRHASPWTDGELADLQRDVGEYFTGRTCLVTGADGFMGSHLTDALVHLDANVHAFVRATSSGALNNIGHLGHRVKVHFADLTDKTSVDYLVRELCDARDRPYVFHLGAQAHVGESWHRPYETVMANTVGTLNLLQSIVDHRIELEKFDTAGTSEEYGNPREAVAHHHDFDDDGSLILHERSQINPMRDFCFCTDGVRGHLTVAAHGIPGDVYVYGQGRNISMREWADLIFG